MKKLLLSFGIFLMLANIIQSQAPQAINYQAVVRDINGAVISNQNVSIQISILSDSVNGASVYSEKHDVITNNLGLVNIVIGKGQVISGDFTNINWGICSYYVKTEADLTGGSNYQLMGISQLLSVPYSLNSSSLVLKSPDGNMHEVKVDDNGNIYGTCLPQPTQSDAGPDQQVLQGTSITLQGNYPTQGQGLWTIEGVVGGSFLDPTDPTTTFNGLTGTFYTLVWTITNNCGSSSDKVNISFFSQCGDTLTDGRDGNVYKTVQIGYQCWMAENLNYSVNNSSCYDYNAANCDIYGRLYAWSAAMSGAASSNSVPSGIQGICPGGWHLPSDAEWTILGDFLGGVYVVGGEMKETGTTHWASPNTGATNSSGFIALPGGAYSKKTQNYGELGINANWWTTREPENYKRLIYDGADFIGGTATSSMWIRYSVRCVKDCLTQPTQSNAGPDSLNIPCDSITLMANTPIMGQGLWKITSGTGGGFADSTNPTSVFYGLSGYTYQLVWTITYNCAISFDTVSIGFQFVCGSTLTDARDGDTYNTVQIGTQCWMSENLAYLPSVSPSSAGSETTPNYYVYDYQGTDVSAAKATGNYQTYGVLYNWPAAMAGHTSSDSVPSGVLGICPNGWHLPSDAEWTVLTDHLGGLSVAGGKMKEAGTTHWNSPNIGATNSSGFTALPAGYRVDIGLFFYLGDLTKFWSSTEDNSSYAWYRNLGYYYADVLRINYDKDLGFTVRCTMD